jgi:hypothetical protein
MQTLWRMSQQVAMLVHGTALDWYAVHTAAIALSSAAAP